MKLDWFLERIGETVAISDIDIVLIGDARSFYFADLLIECTSFHGVVLCTDAVYRLGRMLLREVSRLRVNNMNPMPESLAIVPMKFMEPFPYGEICVIPYANGCGLGDCNWMITKGVDPGLVTFSCFVVSGFCGAPAFFTPPRIPHGKVDVVCVLQASVQHTDCWDILDGVAAQIVKAHRERKRVIIPTFMDDVLYSIMFYLRMKRSINAQFLIASYFYDSLVEILMSLPNANEYVALQNLAVLDLTMDSYAESATVFFAPYPVGDPPFGQVTELTRKYSTTEAIVLDIYGKGAQFTPNTSSMALARFVDEIKPTTVFAPPTFPGEHVDFQGTVDVSDEVVRWIDELEIQKYVQTIGGLQIVSGHLEGETTILGPLLRQCVLNPPDMEELAMRLKEYGATSVRRDGNVVHAVFSFLTGRNEATVSFGDNIIIEADSPRIEAVVQACMGIELNS